MIIAVQAQVSPRCAFNEPECCWNLIQRLVGESVVVLVIGVLCCFRLRDVRNRQNSETFGRESRTPLPFRHTDPEHSQNMSGASRLAVGKVWLKVGQARLVIPGTLRPVPNRRWR